ncbi:MAG: hypothetical protein H3C43_06025 [Leptonema sp. (in: Bacteria)]|nr:hypothetical protein [Leptonema sp. (in: bacteria)]
MIGKLLQIVRSRKVPLNGRDFSRWLFLIPESIIAFVILPISYFIRVLILSNHEQHILELTYLGIAISVLNAVFGFITFFRLRHSIDFYFNANTDSNKIIAVNNLIRLSNRYIIWLGLRLSLIGIFVVIAHLQLTANITTNIVNSIAHILMTLSLILFISFFYSRHLITNLLNQTNFLEVSPSFIRFNQLRNILSFSVFLGIGFLTGSLIFFVQFAIHLALTTNLSNNSMIAPLLQTDKEALNLIAYQILFYIAIIMLPIALFSSFVAHLLLKHQLYHIPLIIKQVGNLANGNLNANIEYVTDDLQGQLSAYFNKLTAAFKQVVQQTEFIIEQIIAKNEDNLSMTKAGRASTKTTSISMDEVTASSTSILQTVQHLDQETERQMKNVETYLQAVESLATRIEEMSLPIEKLTSLYESTRSESSIGRTVLKGLREGMKNLEARAVEIGGIVGFINDISKRVNLLSLNASIEAARAGEAGRGFAIVAEEVSSLADRIADSVKNIHSLIQTNQKESKEGYDNATEATRIFSRVLVDMNTINDVIEEIATSRLELSATNEVVTELNRDVETMIQDISSSSKQQKGSLKEIQTALTEIAKQVDEHKIHNDQLKKEAEILIQTALNLKEILSFFKN